MIRRPLNERFADKVLAGIKTTTIRDNFWPWGIPIMLFRWEGKPYRSKQVNIAPVVVEQTASITIYNGGGRMIYRPCPLFVTRLWHSEGFASQEEMDEWFRPLVKDGDSARKFIMRFRMWTCADSDRYFDTHGKLP